MQEEGGRGRRWEEQREMRRGGRVERGNRVGHRLDDGGGALHKFAKSWGSGTWCVKDVQYVRL